MSRDDSGYTLSHDPARLDVDVIHRFLSTDAYWSPGVPRALVERAIASSLVAAVYAADGALVGFARAVTDRATFAYLADVFVLPPHRGRGLAERLTRALLDHPDMATIRRWVLVTRDAHGVYERAGFSALAAPQGYMERVRDAAEIYRDR